MPTTFPPLNEATLQAANCIGAWLAQSDVSAGSAAASDAGLVVLAGNAVIPVIEAACRLATAQRLLLISGGIGHSTPFLRQAVVRHPRYCAIATDKRTEAAIIADIAHRFWHIPYQRMLIEDRSTNCGENARFTRALLAQRGVACRDAIVVQDPTMQRRTMATFARIQETHSPVTRWLSYAGYFPVLHNGASGLTFIEQNEGVWPVDRYLSLLLGELPRLRDDESGYGPRGKDFIVHVHFPDDVMAAWRSLRNDESLRELLTARALI